MIYRRSAKIAGKNVYFIGYFVFWESALEEGQEKTSKLDIVKVRRQNKGAKFPKRSRKI